MKHVIIGNSAAGINAAEILRELDPEASIAVVSDENTPIYSRCLLTYFLTGLISKPKLLYRPENFYEAHFLDAHIGFRATEIDVKNRELVLNNGIHLPYDRLLIATGARSKMPDIPGADLDGVFPLRDLVDALHIEGKAKTAKRAVILGGGLIGMKAAQALKNIGLQVSVIVKSGRVLSQMLDTRSSEIYLELLRETGIEMIPGKEAVAVEGKNSVEQVVLDDGSVIETQLVIVGKGVWPNKELLAEAGGSTGYGIQVDRYLKTDIEAVFAAGDVIETTDVARDEKRINAIWPCAVEQGRVAAHNMTGKKYPYIGSMSMNSLEFFHVPVISMGILSGDSGEFEEESVFLREQKIYKKVLFRGNRMVGMVFVNAIDTAGIVGTLIKRNVDISSVRNRILADDFSFADIYSLIHDQKEHFPEREFRFPEGNTS